MFALSAALVNAYSALFVHSWDVYAVQQADGSYWSAHESLHPSRVVDHDGSQLNRTIGVD